MTYIIFIDEKQNKKNLGVLEAYQLIRSSGGKIMRVTFTKRTTGEERTMVCRTGVTKGVKGTGKSNKIKDLIKNHIVKVWDIQAKGFRSINLDTVKEIRMEGHTITANGATLTKKPKENKIKTIQMSAKCSDMCSMTFLDENGKKVGERDGYVPRFMPEQHWGDYVELNIDVETGRILNWKTPTQIELKKAIESF